MNEKAYQEEVVQLVNDLVKTIKTRKMEQRERFKQTLREDTFDRLLQEPGEGEC